MHYHVIENDEGDLVDLVPFCCDACRRQWCDDNEVEYTGWYGCQEGGDSPEWCANCGTFAGGHAECDCQQDNILVNRFRSVDGERCSCGNWLQLPESLLLG